MAKKDNNTENLILEAAEAEFLEKGFDGARTNSIAERAGVNHAMVHYYFRTKDQLFSRILNEKITELTDSCLSMFSDTSLPIAERMEKGMIAHFEFLKKNPQLPRFIVNEIDHIDISLFRGLFPKVMNLMESIKSDVGEDVEPFHLFLDAVSQNIFPFFILPVASKAKDYGLDIPSLLDSIEKENITVIKKRLGL